MKAVAIKGKRSLETKEIEEPISIEGKVVVNVVKTGICGSDLHYFEGGSPVGLIMGHEFCGIVKDPGSRRDLKPNDRITALPISPCGKCEACQKGNVQYCPETWSSAIGLSLDNPGGLTKTIAIRPDMVIKVPDNVTDNEVALVEPTAVALHAINLAQITIGQRILIVGGGIIGLLSAMFAKKDGASFVAVSETNPNRGQKAVSLKVADKWFNAKEDNCLVSLAKENFDCVIDCSGNASAVSTALAVVKNGGTIVLVGVATENISIPTVLAVMKELTMKGAIAYTKEEFETCIDLLSLKEIEVTKFIDDIVSLEEVEDAFKRLTSGKDGAIKILVDPKREDS